jgi:hypothetical protein
MLDLAFAVVVTVIAAYQWTGAGTVLVCAGMDDRVGDDPLVAWFYV